MPNRALTMHQADRIPDWGRSQIAILVDYGLEHGVALDNLLYGTTLSLPNLEITDPTKAQEAQVIQNLITALTTAPFTLGIEVGRRCNLATFGVLGQALIASKNIKTAAELTAKYLGGDLHFNKISLRKSPKGMLTLFEVVGQYSEAVRQFLIARDMGASIAFHEHVLRSIPELLLEIGFVDDWLPGMELLEKHFDCEVKVKQSENYTVGNTIRHFVTLPFANSLLFNHFEQQLHKLVNRTAGATPESETLRHRIALQLEKFEYQNLSKEQMAKHLNISPRTLTRYLQSEGTTWRVLVRDIRLNRAKILLKSTQHSIESVALSVGFSSASAFSVAFSREYSTSPAAFRLLTSPDK